MHDSPDRTDPPRHAERAAPDDPLLGRVLALVRFLRAGCPWDAQQEPRSLRPYLLEEAHEVAEAIEAGDDDALRAELGDLLLNIAFQVVLAEERGTFGARQVVEALEAKMAARHPHVYSDADAPPDWEAMKARERQARAAEGTGAPAPSEASADPFAGVPAGLEPLSRARRLLDRAGALGFEWPHPAAALAKLEEEAGELRELLRPAGEEGAAADPARVEEEVGDVLLAAVAVARAAGIHPSNAVLAAGERFERRFRRAQRLAAERGLDWERAAPEELGALWREAAEGA